MVLLKKNEEEVSLQKCTRFGAEFNICSLCYLQQTDLLAVYCGSQPGLEKSQLHLPAAQFVNFEPILSETFMFGEFLIQIPKSSI